MSHLRLAVIYVVLFPVVASFFSLLACQQGAYTKELCCGYLYFDRGGHMKGIVREGSSSHGVLADIVQYKYNSAFILVMQKPNINSYRDELAWEIGLASKTYNEDSASRKMNQSLADSILKNDQRYRTIFSRTYNLWFISKDRLYGPFDFDSYYKKRLELEVPEGLVLEM